MSNENASLDLSVPSRQRTLFLMRMNLAAYPTCAEGVEVDHDCNYPDDTMEGVFEQRQSLFGLNISNREQETQARDKFHQENKNILLGQFGGSIRKHSIPETTAEFEVGVEALEWTGKDTTVLAFRGTYSKGDYSNIEHWMTDYLLEKSTDRMKDAWTNDAGLGWKPQMKDRQNHHDELAKLEIRSSESYKKFAYAAELVAAVANNATLAEAIGGLSMQDVYSTGYWKLTKYLVDEVEQRARKGNRTLILRGHSQGGTRAQLASMYLQQSTGTLVPTETFAATGSACVARSLFHTGANFLDDVNPFISYDHMTDYVHPLDPWGNAMLGMDNGVVCYWGKANLKSVTSAATVNDKALQYCSKIYGWSGPTLIAAQAGAYSPPGTSGKELTRNFQRCRYFTHTAEAILLGLQALDAIDDCHSVPPIPLEDPEGQCPTGVTSLAEEEVLLVAVLFTILVLACCCGGGYLFFRRCKPSEHKHSVILEDERESFRQYGDGGQGVLDVELTQIS